MFSVFPALLDFAILGTFLLRVVTGLFFLAFGLRLFQATLRAQGKSTLVLSLGLLYAFSKVAVGALLFVGVFTQPASLLGALLILYTLIQERRFMNRSAQQVQILLFFLCISLLLLGAGAFAFDMPL